MSLVFHLMAWCYTLLIYKTINLTPPPPPFLRDKGQKQLKVVWYFRAILSLTFLIKIGFHTILRNCKIIN